MAVAVSYRLIILPEKKVEHFDNDDSYMMVKLSYKMITSMLLTMIQIMIQIMMITLY